MTSNRPSPLQEPTPSAIKTSHQTVSAANGDDWDIIKEKNKSDDSSDGKPMQSRTA